MIGVGAPGLLEGEIGGVVEGDAAGGGAVLEVGGDTVVVGAVEVKTTVVGLSEVKVDGPGLKEKDAEAVVIPGKEPARSSVLRRA